MRAIQAILAAALMLPWAAMAATEQDFQVPTTRDLVDLCSASSTEGPISTAALNFCQGFLLGSVLVQIEHDAADPRHKIFCLPSPPPTRSAAMDGFVTWAKADPARMTLRPADGFFSYLAETYACPVTAKKPAKR